MKLKIHVPLVFLLWSFFSTALQAQLSMEAEFRPRFEVRDGYRELAEPAATPSWIISQRTRLSFSYVTDRLRLHVTPQDVRVWGDEQLASSTGVYGDHASLDLLEAYAEIEMGKNTWVSVGRQQLAYDRQRLLAARNWNQNGLAYDAVVLKFTPHPWSLHVGVSWNSMEASLSDNYYPSSRIKSLNYLWLHKDFPSGAELSFLHIASGVTPSDSVNTLHFRQTTGFYGDYRVKPLHLRANAYYQFGRNNNGSKVRAFLADVEAGFILEKFNPGLGISYLSGDSQREDATDHLFDPLYGARHRFFGHMDYFRDFASHTQHGGLIDGYVFLKYRWSPVFSLSNTTHYFQLAQTNAETPENRALGYENEIAFDYRFREWGTLQGGYLFHIPTDSFKTLQGVEDGGFSSLMFVNTKFNLP